MAEIIPVIVVAFCLLAFVIVISILISGDEASLEWLWDLVVEIYKFLGLGGIIAIIALTILLWGLFKTDKSEG